MATQIPYGTTFGKTADTETFQEGPVARRIESFTARIPSDVFLWTAGGAIATSLALQVFGLKKTSLFVGQWVPTILLLGLYNKIVKELGHDRQDRGFTSGAGV